jgi:hypothetical protein
MAAGVENEDIDASPFPTSKGWYTVLVMVDPSQPGLAASPRSAADKWAGLSVLGAAPAR